MVSLKVLPLVPEGRGYPEDKPEGRGGRDGVVTCGYSFVLESLW